MCYYLNVQFQCQRVKQVYRAVFEPILKKKVLHILDFRADIDDAFKLEVILFQIQCLYPF